MVAATKATNRIAKAVEKNGDGKIQAIAISPPKMEVLALTIRGTAPLVINRFSAKALEKMKQTQEAGSVARKGQKREPKDFKECYEQAKHVSTDGWLGIPATAFRSACVSACRLVGFKMTHAKLGVSIEADGFDRVDGTPLVKITKGEPKMVTHYVRNDGGSTDIRARPMWEPDWEAVVRIRYDADMFTPSDVVNLLARVGVQVGVGAGRPDSRDSCGCGWGVFSVVSD